MYHIFLLKLKSNDGRSTIISKEMVVAYGMAGLSHHLHWGLRKTTKTSYRGSGLRAEISSRELANT